MICNIGESYLPGDCYFSELALKNLTKRVGLVQSGYHHHLIETCSYHDIAEQLLSWH